MPTIQEEWRDIKGYDGKYQVSNTGKVRSLNYYNRGEVKEIQQTVNDKGYYTVNIRCDKNIRKTTRVHKIVAECFIDKPKGKKLEVNHIDADKSNNDVNNLEWITHTENVRHAYSHGLLDGQLDKLNKLAMQRRKKVIAIKIDSGAIFEFESITETANKIGTCNSRVRKTLNGQQEQSRGFYLFYGEVV